jgi:N-acyl-D-amino-acid deacylase
MTGLTAKTFGLEDRGVLRAGAFADLTLFDAGTIDEAASFARPIQPAKGIDTVLVNGELVWRNGKATGQRPGRVLRRRS